MHNNELGLLCDVLSRALENNASALKKTERETEREILSPEKENSLCAGCKSEIIVYNSEKQMTWSET